MPERDETNIICMKWGTKYGPDYVLRLRRMVKANLKRPHRFVCFTDDPTELGEGIEIRPLDAMDQIHGLPERGWRKLTSFASPLADLKGTALFLDLDVVITGSLDPLFEIEGPFFICHDHNWYGQRKITGNSSVYRFEIGAYPEIIEEFHRDFPAIRERLRNEQEFLSEWMHERGLLNYWPDNWCVSFKHQCIPTWPLRYVMTPSLPEGSRVVIFHGFPDPPDAIEGRYKNLFKYYRPAPWITKYWDVLE